MFYRGLKLDRLLDKAGYSVYVYQNVTGGTKKVFLLAFAWDL